VILQKAIFFYFDNMVLLNFFEVEQPQLRIKWTKTYFVHNLYFLNWKAIESGCT